jgi:ABC-type glycerol-3-phosphate transport system substrate-binding protein
LPLTVNPHGLWYRRDLLHRAGQVSRPDNVEAAIGANWETFLTFCATLYTNAPNISIVADAIDDIFTPMQYQLPPFGARTGALSEYYRTIVTTTTTIQQRGYAADAPRASGKWLDLLQRDQITMVIGGSSLRSSLSPHCPERRIPMATGAAASGVGSWPGV